MSARRQVRPPARALLDFEPFALEADERPGPGKADGPEEQFATQCRAHKLPEFEQQHRFAVARFQRNWRFDFAWRSHMIAVEIEGLVMQRKGGTLVVMGRHASPAGIIEDMDKYNAAAICGWTVLRFPQKYVKPGHAIQTTVALFAARGWAAP